MGRARKDIGPGDAVFAKWPGSAKYFEATVDEVLEFEYRVTFKDGTTMEVEKRDVYREGFFQRSRSSSPARRGRSRSPGRRRSRSRSRSPARKTSTPKRSTSESPPRGKRPVGRPKKGTAPEIKEPEEEKKVEETPKKTPHVRQTRSSRVEQETTSTRLTRSVTKTMVKEEKEALFDKDKLDEELKEKSRKSRRPEYEFGGPLGAFFFILALPALVYAFYFFCNGKGNSCTFNKNVIKNLPRKWQTYFNEGSLIVVGWIVFQAILYSIPVGSIAQGVALPDGKRLNYRTNGFMAFVVTIAALLLMKSKNIPLTYVYDKYPALITSATILSILIAEFVYIKARREGTGLSPTGNTGNMLYDFFIGHQLNPRIGNFDLKFFFEMRPGLIGWIIINFCMASQEFKNFGKVSPAMIMVCAFQLIYVMDALIFEASILSTIDIVHEGFGFMLAFGNIVFVPFMFSIQARYLADHRVNIPWPLAVAIIFIKVMGYVVFRGSNLQKDFFKRDPDDPDFKEKETILTASGRRLMAFGWWRIVRHPNYLGDILMAVSWSLTCGFSHLIPWLYPIYLFCLLIHRQRRVQALCLKKYGKSYEEYCRRVPYRIFPYLY